MNEITKPVFRWEVTYYCNVSHKEYTHHVSEADALDPQTAVDITRRAHGADTLEVRNVRGIITIPYFSWD